MRWHNGRSRRSREPVPGKCLQGSVIKKDEGAAHPIQARSSLLQQRPDTFAQTNSVILTFRLQNGGGPYIPVRRSLGSFVGLLPKGELIACQIIGIVWNEEFNRTRTVRELPVELRLVYFL